MRRSDGAFITGDAVRQLLKIPKGGKGSAKKRVAVDTDRMPDFSLFVQSTSHNRVLMPNTRVLYRRARAAAAADGEVGRTSLDEGGVAAAVVGTGRGCGTKGGGGGGVRQVRSAAKRSSLTKATSKADKTERKNDDREEEGEVEAAKKGKMSPPISKSASPGGQGFAVSRMKMHFCFGVFDSSRKMKMLPQYSVNRIH